MVRKRCVLSPQLHSHRDSRRFGCCTGGDLEVYHSHIAFNPSAGFGVVVLFTGLFANAPGLAYSAIQTYQTAFDLHHASLVREWYAGEWESDDGQSQVRTVLEMGAIWISKLVLNGTDIFNELGIHGKGNLGLWAVEGRREEFRCAVFPRYRRVTSLMK